MEENLKHSALIRGPDIAHLLPRSSSLIKNRFDGFEFARIAQSVAHLLSSAASPSFLDSLLSDRRVDDEAMERLTALCLLQRVDSLTDDERAKLKKQETEEREVEAESKEPTLASKLESVPRNWKDTANVNDKTKNSSAKAKALNDDDSKLLMTVRAPLHPKHEIQS